MRRLSLLALTAFLSFVITPVSAGQPKITTTPPTLLESSKNDLGKTKIVGPGQFLIGTRAAYLHTATISKTVSLEIHGVTFEAPSSEILLRGSTDRPSYYRLTESSLLYCASWQQLAKHRRTGRVTNNGKTKTIELFDEFVRLCFIDAEANGQFSRAILDGAKHPSSQNTFEIDPIRYLPSDLRYPMNSGIGVYYHPQLVFNRPVLVTVSNFNRSAFYDALIRYRKENDGGFKRMPDHLRLSNRNLPYSITYQNAVLTILTFNEVSKELSYRIDAPFLQSDAKITIYDTTRPGVPYNYK